MQGIVEALQSPVWWFSTIVVALLINIAAGYAIRVLDHTRGSVGDAWRKATARRRRLAQALADDPKAFEAAVCWQRLGNRLPGTLTSRQMERVRQAIARAAKLAWFNKWPSLRKAEREERRFMHYGVYTARTSAPRCEKPGAKAGLSRCSVGCGDRI